MGRSAHQSSEGPGAHTPAWLRTDEGPDEIRPLRERLLDFPRVDQLFEPATDLLACSEEIVVSPPAGREMHDSYRVVALAVAACVCSRLVEGP
jgi:hypothetical protein